LSRGGANEVVDEEFLAVPVAPSSSPAISSPSDWHHPAPLEVNAIFFPEVAILPRPSFIGGLIST
jgi:hypothetical protein